MADNAAATRLPRWHPNPHIRAAIEAIRRRGHLVTTVRPCECPDVRRDGCGAPDCGFAYTAGLTLSGLPELVVYGLDPDVGVAVLDEVDALLRRHDWRDLVVSGTEIALRSRFGPVRLIEVIDKDEMLMANLLFPDCPALQVIWPDEYGRYPLDPDYALLPLHQEVRGVADLATHRAPRPRIIRRG